MVAESPRDPGRVEEEMGDLLFALVNLARKLEIEPEAALRVANDKFQRRFEDMIRNIHSDGLRIQELDLVVLETYWQKVKGNTKDTKDTKDQITTTESPTPRRA
jgi:uncharacterized protein YabN with tetrapyrrole methylase and pyrophosphatase domain